MRVTRMKRRYPRRRIGIARSPRKRSVRSPPAPVLNDAVKRYVVRTVRRNHRLDFARRRIRVLALPPPVRPFRKHGRGTGDVAVPRNDRVELRAVNEKIVPAVVHQIVGRKVERRGLRRMAAKIHQNAVASGGHEKRYDVHPVGLMHIKGKAADIQRAVSVRWKGRTAPVVVFGPAAGGL